MRRNGMQSMSYYSRADDFQSQPMQLNADNRYPQYAENRYTDNSRQDPLFEQRYAQHYTQHCFNDGRPYQDPNFFDYFNTKAGMGNPLSFSKGKGTEEVPDLSNILQVNHIEPQPRGRDRNYGLSTYNVLTEKDAFTKPRIRRRRGISTQTDGLQESGYGAGYQADWSYMPSTPREYDFQQVQSTGMERGNSGAELMGSLVTTCDWGQANYPAIAANNNPGLNNAMWANNGNNFQTMAYGNEVQQAGMAPGAAYPQYNFGGNIQ